MTHQEQWMNKSILRQESNQYFIEDVKLTDIAQKFGTPAYVYSKKSILDQINFLQNALSDIDHLICFAVKANSNLSILKIFKESDCGFDIVSGGELQRVLTVDSSNSKIVFSGVGKSVLLSMMTKYSAADVIVVGLIGERSREVLEFVGKVFDPETKKKLCAVAVPADRSPLLRIRGANRATAIAEYFRDQGKNVLLIMDSLTRVAHARREIGLALGELPTSKGYPASVIALISGLVERAGMGLSATKGSITGIYTVLADGDDNNDPVVDTARAILDGHVVLNREYANMGIYPAIDISQSVSRVMVDVVTRDHSIAADRLKQLINVYNENKDLILMGGYAPGQDPDLDEAYKKWPKIVEFLKQNPSKVERFDNAAQALTALLKEGT